MSTLNGIGTRFYGFTEADEQGRSFATKWFTFLYLPVVPLGRKEIQREITYSNVFRYRILKEQPNDKNEIKKTYIWGWLIGPIILLWPMLFIIPEVKKLIESIASALTGSHFDFQITSFIILVLNIILVTWKWKDWDEERGLPKNYKEILKERKKKS